MQHLSFCRSTSFAEVSAGPASDVDRCRPTLYSQRPLHHGLLRLDTECQVVATKGFQPVNQNLYSTPSISLLRGAHHCNLYLDESFHRQRLICRLSFV